MVKTDILGFGYSIREELSTMSMPCLYSTGTQAYIIRACSCMSGRRWDIPLHLHSNRHCRLFMLICIDQMHLC